MGGEMRYPVRSKRLGWIFGLVVFVPGILLAVIAVRSINREEAYIEKQLEGTLLAEVVYLVSLAETELGRIEKDLADSAPLDPLTDPQGSLSQWREASPLVVSTFVLSPEFEILWPRAGGHLDEEQLSFLSLNSDFLSNRLEVPVFEDIATTFKDEIVAREQQEPDKVAGLEMGADDYVVKPFGVSELLARIRALLRRRCAATGPEPKQSEPFRFGDVEIDPQRLQGNKGGQTFVLTTRELELLSLFLKARGQVLSRSQILDEIWGIYYEGTTRTLDQHIAKLRKKIEDDPAHPRYIVTVHRVGYRFDSPADAGAGAD